MIRILGLLLLILQNCHMWPLTLAAPQLSKDVENVNVEVSNNDTRQKRNPQLMGLLQKILDKQNDCAHLNWPTAASMPCSEGSNTEYVDEEADLQLIDLAHQDVVETANQICEPGLCCEDHHGHSMNHLQQTPEQIRTKDDEDIYYMLANAQSSYRTISDEHNASYRPPSSNKRSSSEHTNNPLSEQQPHDDFYNYPYKAYAPAKQKSGHPEQQKEYRTKTHHSSASAFPHNLKTAFYEQHAHEMRSLNELQYDSGHDRAKTADNGRSNKNTIKQRKKVKGDSGELNEKTKSTDGDNKRFRDMRIKVGDSEHHSDMGQRKKMKSYSEERTDEDKIGVARQRIDSKNYSGQHKNTTKSTNDDANKKWHAEMRQGSKMKINFREHNDRIKVNGEESYNKADIQSRQKNENENPSREGNDRTNTDSGDSHRKDSEEVNQKYKLRKNYKERKDRNQIVENGNQSTEYEEIRQRYNKSNSNENYSDAIMRDRLKASIKKEYKEASNSNRRSKNSKERNDRTKPTDGRVAIKERQHRTKTSDGNLHKNHQQIVNEIGEELYPKPNPKKKLSEQERKFEKPTHMRNKQERIMHLSTNDDPSNMRAIENQIEISFRSNPKDDNLLEKKYKKNNEQFNRKLHNVQVVAPSNMVELTTVSNKRANVDKQQGKVGTPIPDKKANNSKNRRPKANADGEKKKLKQNAPKEQKINADLHKHKSENNNKNLNTKNEQKVTTSAPNNEEEMTGNNRTIEIPTYIEDDKHNRKDDSMITIMNQNGGHNGTHNDDHNGKSSTSHFQFCVDSIIQTVLSEEQTSKLKATKANSTDIANKYPDHHDNTEVRKRLKMPKEPDAPIIIITTINNNKMNGNIEAKQPKIAEKNGGQLGSAQDVNDFTAMAKPPTSGDIEPQIAVKQKPNSKTLNDKKEEDSTVNPNKTKKRVRKDPPNTTGRNIAPNTGNRNSTADSVTNINNNKTNTSKEHSGGNENSSEKTNGSNEHRNEANEGMVGRPGPRIEDSFCDTEEKDYEDEFVEQGTSTREDDDRKMHSRQDSEGSATHYYEYYMKPERRHQNKPMHNPNPRYSEPIAYEWNRFKQQHERHKEGNRERDYYVNYEDEDDHGHGHGHGGGNSDDDDNDCNHNHRRPKKKKPPTIYLTKIIKDRCASDEYHPSSQAEPRAKPFKELKPYASYRSYDQLDEDPQNSYFDYDSRTGEDSMDYGKLPRIMQNSWQTSTESSESMDSRSLRPDCLGLYGYPGYLS